MLLLYEIGNKYRTKNERWIYDIIKVKHVKWHREKKNMPSVQKIYYFSLLDKFLFFSGLWCKLKTLVLLSVWGTMSIFEQ